MAPTEENAIGELTSPISSKVVLEPSDFSFKNRTQEIQSIVERLHSAGSKALGLNTMVYTFETHAGIGVRFPRTLREIDHSFLADFIGPTSIRALTITLIDGTNLLVIKSGNTRKGKELIGSQQERTSTAMAELVPAK